MASGKIHFEYTGLDPESTFNARRRNVPIVNREIPLDNFYLYQNGRLGVSAVNIGSITEQGRGNLIFRCNPEEVKMAGKKGENLTQRIEITPENPTLPLCKENHWILYDKEGMIASIKAQYKY